MPYLFVQTLLKIQFALARWVKNYDEHPTKYYDLDTRMYPYQLDQQTLPPKFQIPDKTD